MYLCRLCLQNQSVKTSTEMQKVRFKIWNLRSLNGRTEQNVLNDLIDKFPKGLNLRGLNI